MKSKRTFFDVPSVHPFKELDAKIFTTLQKGKALKQRERKKVTGLLY